MSEYLAMDGHGFYVWVSYLVTMVTLVLLFVMSYKSSREAAREVEQLEQLVGARRSSRRRHHKGSE